MKKVTLLTIILLLSGGAIFAESTSGSIVLQGSVPQILEVTVTSTGDASSLDLSATVTTPLKVGTVVEKSNKKAGYTVTLESANAVSTGVNSAYFKSTDPSNTDTLDYTIYYDGSEVTLSGGSAVVSDVSTKTDAGGSSKDVEITYDGASAFMYEDNYEDNYEDTLTFTIAAK